MSSEDIITREERERDLTLTQVTRLKNLFEVTGQMLPHGVESIVDSLVYRDGQYEREEFHCDHYVCKAIMRHFLCRQDSSCYQARQIISKPATVEKVSFALEMKEPQQVKVMDDGEYDFSYDQDDLSLVLIDHRGESYMMVGGNDGYIDCVDSTLEDHLYRKPHHYRRSFAQSQGITLKQSVDGGKIMVIDSMPYNFGLSGGYFERSMPNIIRATALTKRKRIIVVVRGTGASAADWQQVDVIDTRPIHKNFLYDIVRRVSTGYSYSVYDNDDYNMISKPKKGIISRKKKLLGGECKYVILEILRGTDVGMRRGVYNILGAHRTRGYVYNVKDKCESNFFINSHDYPIMIRHLQNFVRDKGLVLTIKSSDDVGIRDEEAIVIISVDAIYLVQS